MVREESSVLIDCHRSSKKSRRRRRLKEKKLDRAGHLNSRGDSLGVGKKNLRGGAASSQKEKKDPFPSGHIDVNTTPEHRGGSRVTRVPTMWKVRAVGAAGGIPGRGGERKGGDEE